LPSDPNRFPIPNRVLPNAGIPLDWKDTFLNRYGFDTEATGGAVEFRLHCAHVRQPAQKVYRRGFWSIFARSRFSR
jgi:hypothetical protein